LLETGKNPPGISDLQKKKTIGVEINFYFSFFSILKNRLPI
jgi:hypothetical protein